MGSNLPAVSEVTLGGHSSSSLTMSRCKIGIKYWLGKIRVDCEDHYVQVRENTGNGASTLALNAMGRVNQNSKQRVPVALQNGNLSPQFLNCLKVFKPITLDFFKRNFYLVSPVILSGSKCSMFRAEIKLAI